MDPQVRSLTTASMGLLNQFNRESARVLLLTVIPLACAAPFNSSTPGNITVSVPEGTSNHGDPKLLCTPTGWKDVAIFFLGDFAAHVATVKLHPGESILSAPLAMIFAFFFPTSSITRGLEAIIRHARTGSTPLQKAQKAGALCEVVRTHDWEPQPGDYVREDGLKLPDWCQAPVVETKDVSRTESRAPGTHQSTSVTALQITSEPTNVWVKERTSPFKPSGKGISLDSRKIHGVCRLPSGYELAVVHADCIVEELTQSENRGQIEDPPQAPTSAELSSSYNLAKAAAAILQLVYGSATLLLARGDQLERYGYAAFGLTVAPYLVMSLVNLLGALLTPDYSVCFMPESEIMEEAERHGGAVFQGMVGKLKYPEGAI